MSKTVKVRIAVAVDPTGCWNSAGGGSLSDSDAMEFAAEVLETGEAHFWLTAELPVPEVTEVAATVEHVP